jgi:hypothetical protein
VFFSKVLRRTPSPVAHRLEKTPARATLSPKGAREASQNFGYRQKPQTQKRVAQSFLPLETLRLSSESTPKRA